MYLCHYVEIGKGIGDIEGAVEILLVFVREDFMVVPNKVEDHIFNFIDRFYGINVDSTVIKLFYGKRLILR